MDNILESFLTKSQERTIDYHACRKLFAEISKISRLETFLIEIILSNLQQTNQLKLP